ncbi:DegT/DnrJ/EryC1/StrS family aminotransferase, partial [Serratia sp. ASV30]|uniref:DegT/DnrJ/EryC1/StrS family aminotransferase n=1 Tax=Serratia sp. ASV30 TaxID=2795127 RepID=UPI001E35BF2F
MSEINAAFGLLQLKHVDKTIQRRKEIDEAYHNAFEKLEGITIVPQSGQVDANYAYFPILVEDEFRMNREELYHYLKQNNVYSRRYFYPLITDFSMYKGMKSASKENLPVANEIARKVLCLPIYPN